jgi:hypothetical protein
MPDVRACDQCGMQFVARREHGRFCSTRCRVAWNRRTIKYSAGEATALDWSMTAMLETVDRLPRLEAWDGARAIAVIGEAVWWVTIVDATMVRYHPESYDNVMTEAPAVARAAIEETLAGLRFVRNHMAHDIDLAAFIKAGPARRSGFRDCVASWTWRRLPRPSLDMLSPQAQEWELDRYHAYRGRLADHAVGEAFGRAREFLVQAATAAAPTGLGASAPS